MPTFQIEQDGRRFKVQAASMQDATEALKSHLEAAKPSPGTGESLARGVMQGTTGNFSDELFALSKAGGGGVDDPRMGIDHLIKGAVKYFTGDKDAAAAYEAEVAKERDRNKQASEEHPVAFTGGAVGGAMMVPAGVGGAAVTLPARMAAGAGVGAGFGALSGAGQGEGAADSLDKAITGGGLGVLSGGAAPVAMRGVEAVAPYAVKAIEPIKNALRGYSEPEAEAARRVVSAVARDYKNGDPGLSGAEFKAAKAAGQPVANMDMGGETTRALARSAANTNPESRAILNRTIDDRFDEQSPRLASWLRSTFHYPNADAQQTALDTIARTVNRPNYAKAYSDGANMKFTETLEQISQAPVVQEAIRRAMASAKNEAAKLGFTPPKTPFRFDETGRLKLKANEDGSKMEPNLQFWDHVKRALDKTATPEAKDWARILREHLDEVVPSYATARAGAAKFFGAGDALEAGENFVGASQRFGIPETRKALAKMSPEERQLFQDGYISRLVQTIEKTGDRRNVVNQIMGSEAAREEMHVAIGAARTKELEARLRVENIMDRMRGAVQGNSTTARQLAEAGLAGGITGGAGYGLATGDWNPKDVGLATVLGSMLSSGGRYAGGKVQAGIDQRVAKKVAEMLVSDDPKVLQKGLAIVAKNNSAMAALRTADDALARAGGSQLSGVSVPQLPGIGPGRADEQPDRPRAQ